MTAEEKPKSGKFFEIADQHVKAGNLEEAEKVYKQILSDYVDKGSVALASFHLALTLEKRNLPDQAVQYYLQAIAAHPAFAEAHLNYGVLMRKTNRFDEALESFMRAASFKPLAEAYANIGPILHNRGKFNEALHHYQRALALKPDHVETMNNLGALYVQAGKYDEAEDQLKKAMEIKPNAVSINHLCILYLTFGRLEDAIAAYRRGLQASPFHISLHNNLLLAMVYAASVSSEELSETACNFSRSIADPLLRQRPFTNDKSSDRKLRIGYVSPDFRKHVVNYFFENLLKAHDRRNFEIYGYYSNASEDEVTKRLKSSFDHWRNISAKTDDESADIIEQDKIDILVDLAGHTGQNRLLVFARKPAPVQVTWLGWPATTGMKAMDYRITDVHAEPEGLTEHLSVETLWRLPEIFCCYQPPETSPAVIDHPPFEESGYITFGCCNNFSKVTDQVLTSWAKILVQVPDSRLLVEIIALENQKFRDGVESRMRKAGLPMERVTLQPRKKDTQFMLYNKIDIALDPFPCNGGTTSFDTLWMGVPFVALAGNNFVSRMGVTILTNAGLPELIAGNVDEYVEIAVNLAHDRARLKKIRHKLRDKIIASPLMNRESFALNMEAAYRGMWRKWCSK